MASLWEPLSGTIDDKRDSLMRRISDVRLRMALLEPTQTLNCWLESVHTSVLHMEPDGDSLAIEALVEASEKLVEVLIINYAKDP